MTREEFLEARRQFIGGSDIASISQIGDYACARRVYYDKTREKKDFDNSDKPEFRRGHRLEPIAAAYYEEVTKRTVRLIGQRKHDLYPRAGVSMDRLVEDKSRSSPGYLEIKTVSDSSFYFISKKGLNDAYILQLQYGMAVSNLSWGSFCIYAPQKDRIMHFDVEADLALGAELLLRAQNWWLYHVDNKIIPASLPMESKPCEDCEYRIVCRQTTDELEF